MVYLDLDFPERLKYRLRITKLLRASHVSVDMYDLLVTRILNNMRWKDEQKISN
jgi:hypothetical protein